MVTRRQAREWALMFLTSFDLNPQENADSALAAFWEQQEELERERVASGERVKKAFCSVDAAVRASLEEMKTFAESRVKGVCAQRRELDARIEAHLKNWKLYRLGTVERNVLRLGAWELLNCADVPSPIVINESVDIAKYFSETKSGRFVNGVLDNLAKEIANQKGAGEWTPAK